MQSKVPKEALGAVQAVHNESKRDEFLMKLHPKFESVRVGFINRKPVPTLDECLGELLHEKQHLASQHGTASTEIFNMAYAAQGKGRFKSSTQCYSCKEFGHVAKNCSKKFCNYYKKKGHIIKDCRIRPQNRSAYALYTAGQSNLVTMPLNQPAIPRSYSTLTPKHVQQIIVSALGLQGKTKLLPSPWLIDFAASNHDWQFQSTTGCS